MRHKSIYQDKDDGLHQHKGDGYYEWWYFDANFDNGYSCVLTWHWRNGFLKPHIPAIQIFIYTPDGTRRVGMAAVKPEECEARQDFCYVRMGDSFCRQEDGLYRTKMHAKGVGAKLVFRSLLPGFKPASGFVYRSKAAEHGHSIAIPRGVVDGSLYLYNHVIRVKGLGYHDHNWGSVNMYECLGGWYWGSLFDPTYTDLRINVAIERRKTKPSFFVFSSGDKPILETDRFQFIIQRTETDEITGKSTARDILIKSSHRKSGIQFQCRLNTKMVVECSKLPQTTDWPQYNWRFLADYQAEIEIGGVADKCLVKRFTNVFSCKMREIFQ